MVVEETPTPTQILRVEVSEMWKWACFVNGVQYRHEMATSLGLYFGHHQFQLYLPAWVVRDLQGWGIWGLWE